jgi:hypothetical protein
LALGRVVDWHVVQQEAPGRFTEFDVWFAADNPEVVHVSEITTVSSAQPGVTVTVSELSKEFPQLKGESAVQGLCELFAIYLRTYPKIRISLAASVLDPSSVTAGTKNISMPPIRYQETEYPASLELIAWRVPTERFVYFCDERGLALGRSHLRFQVPGLNFSAHLQSPLVTKLSQDGVLGLEEMHPALTETLDRITDEVKTFYRERLVEEAKDAVAEWKSEHIYPFEGEAATPVERIERQVFDIVASRVNQHLPDFTTSGKKSKQFQLRLLRQAIEKSPDDLRRILSQVLDLPQAQRKELADLLEYVSLSGIIAAAKVVADRLQFLAGLEELLFDPTQKKGLKERRQLHRLLVPNTWLFGETFALSVDDQSLNEVLKKHLELEKRKDVDLALPVLRSDGRRGIIDLMFSRRIPRGKDEERDHLVVELKRPTVKVGSKELTQVEEYAVAVASDERFRAVKATWDFWLLANDYDSFVAVKAAQPNRPDGLIIEFKDPHIRIWVKTWAQVLEENRSRLRFIERSLGYVPDYELALQRIKDQHSELFKTLVPDNEETEPANTTTEYEPPEPA